MKKTPSRHYRRTLLLLDLIMLVVSFACALFLRYRVDAVHETQVVYYRQLFIAEILLYLLLYFRRRTNGTVSQIARLDPFENLTRVVKNQIILFALLLVYMYATWSSAQASRLMIGYAFLLNIVLDYIARMCYRTVLKRRAAEPGIAHRLLIVCEERDRERLLARLNSTLPSDHEIVRTVTSAVAKDSALSMDGNTCDSALLFLPEAAPELIHSLVEHLRGAGLDVFQMLSTGSVVLPTGIGTSFAGMEALHFTAMQERCRIMDVDFTVSTLPESAFFVRDNLPALQGGYLCFCNVHTTVMAHSDTAYRAVQNNSSITFMDGNPIAALARRSGYPNAMRVAGPDFMALLFELTSDGSLRHFFYGASEETLHKLRENLITHYPGIAIAGMISPPFRALTAEEEDAHIATIRQADPDILWVGLGAPKQEQWMARHKGVFRGVMVGVGAGFDFHAGTIKRAPQWVQKIGLEWFYRLLQDPKRLFSRYVSSNLRFLFYVASHGWKNIL